jgi:hypothetical protein
MDRERQIERIRRRNGRVNWADALLLLSEIDRLRAELDEANGALLCAVAMGQKEES